MSVGAFCDRRMAEMMQRHQLIGDVRGIGAFPFNVVFFSLFLGSVTAPRRHAVDTRWLASANVHAPKFVIFVRAGLLMGIELVVDRGTYHHYHHPH